MSHVMSHVSCHVSRPSLKSPPQVSATGTQVCSFSGERWLPRQLGQVRQMGLLGSGALRDLIILECTGKRPPPGYHFSIKSRARDLTGLPILVTCHGNDAGAVGQPDTALVPSEVASDKRFGVHPRGDAVAAASHC